MALKKGVSLSYEFQGWNRVENSLRKLASDHRGQTDGAVKDWAKDERADLKAFGYPPQRNAPQPFVSDRQRKWFFWALASGLITVPYQRTGRLANSWRARKEGWSHWVIENSAAYGALVVGRDKQVKYHAGHWWIADDIIEEDTPDLTKNIKDEIMELVEL